MCSLCWISRWGITFCFIVNGVLLCKGDHGNFLIMAWSIDCGSRGCCATPPRPSGRLISNACSMKPSKAVHNQALLCPDHLSPNWAIANGHCFIDKSGIWRCAGITAAPWRTLFDLVSHTVFGAQWQTFLSVIMCKWTPLKLLMLKALM